MSVNGSRTKTALYASMSSTRSVFAQVAPRRVTSFRVLRIGIYAAQRSFCSGFDSRQLHKRRAAEMRPFLFDGADELQSAASRWCRSLSGAVGRVERAVRHSPGLRCFLNVRVAPWAGLAGTTAQPNVDARSGGGARCVPSANPSVARVRERVRWEISHGRRRLKRRFTWCAPKVFWSAGHSGSARTIPEWDQRPRYLERRRRVGGRER